MIRIMRMLLITLLVCVGCGKNEEPPPPSTGSPNAPPETGPRSKKAGGGGATQAQQMFATVCATCHGADGTGTGPASESLNPKPRNYTDAAWQASVTDDDIRKIIVQGGQPLGKSAMMPGNPQLQEQPEVLEGLVQIIRGFAKK